MHGYSVQWLATFLIVLCGAQCALALPLAPFRYEAQAQQNCPGDTVVWLDFKKGRYYLKGQRRYAHGHTGSPFEAHDDRILAAAPVRGFRHRGRTG